jgi:phosphoglycerate dehydrogenase-like enzyme
MMGGTLMNKRKLVITQTVEQTYMEQIKTIIPDWELIAGKDREIWENHIKDAEVIAGWKKGMEKECLQQDSKLKWVQSWSAGVNSFPLEELETQNILLTSANGVHSYPISETILAFMLSLTRKIHTYVQNQQAKNWDHSNLKSEMHKKTIGIIGVGTIGRETAKIAKAFGMTVLGIRRTGGPEDFCDKMYKMEHLHTILPQCDYVVITLPLTKETRHLFTKEQFSLMKPSAFFINIGRGEIVKENDLIDALQNGIIAGAGLDVFEKEPLSEDSPLWEMENVIMTPHSAGSTEHYNQRVIEDIFIPNLQKYAVRLTPDINLVSYSKGY